MENTPDKEPAKEPAKKPAKEGWLILAFFAFFALLYFYYLFYYPANNSPQPQTTAQITQEIDTSNREVMRILFIGNSYTFFNEMPKIIEELARHDPDAQFLIETDMFVEGGANLARLYNRPEAMSYLNKKPWDYVVLQPWSVWAVAKTHTISTNQALKAWVGKINKIGAQPVFFMTWPRQPGSDWYSSKETRRLLKSPQIMYKKIQSYSNTFAKKHNLLLMPVADYWMSSLKRHPELTLYDQDGSHPSPEGSFFTAMLFYKMLVNNTLSDITYHPQYLDDGEIKTITDIISSPLP